MLEAMKNKRIQWIEQTQILCCLLIVYHHSIPNFTQISKAVEVSAGIIHFPALAVFFVTSGFFSAKWKKKTYGIYIKERAIRLLTPWIIVSLLMILPKAVLSSAEVRSNILSTSVIFISFLDPHGSGICPHLWFLPTLFLLQVTVYVLDLIDKNKVLKLILLTVLLLIASLDVTLPTIFCLNELRMYAFWFALGYVLHRVDLSQLRPNIYYYIGGASLLTCTLIIFSKEILFSRMLISIAGAVFISCFALVVESAQREFIKLFSGKTYIIYLFSLCAQNLVEVTMNKLHINGNTAFIVMFFIGIAVPLIIYYFFQKIEDKVNGKFIRFIRIAFGM